MEKCNHNSIGFIIANNIFIGAKCFICNKTWDIEEVAKILQEMDMLFSKEKEYIQ